MQVLFRADATAPCLPIWRTLKASATPAVIVRPGVVIGNAGPDGLTAPRAASFAGNGHRDKLLRAGVTVHEVGAEPTPA